MTISIPTDDALAGLPTTDRLQSLPTNRRAVLLSFHVLHSYYPLGSLESIVNPVQPTLVIKCTEAGRFTLNFTRFNGSVAIDLDQPHDPLPFPPTNTKLPRQNRAPRLVLPLAGAPSSAPLRQSSLPLLPRIAPSRQISLSPRRCRVASPSSFLSSFPWQITSRRRKLDFFRSAIRWRPSPRAASRSCPCASSTTSSLARRRRPRSRSSPSGRPRVGRRDAEAEAELQAIEAAYATESGKRRRLPDWSKTPVPAAACASLPRHGFLLTTSPSGHRRHVVLRLRHQRGCIQWLRAQRRQQAKGPPPPASSMRNTAAVTSSSPASSSSHYWIGTNS